MSDSFTQIKSHEKSPLYPPDFRLLVVCRIASVVSHVERHESIANQSNIGSRGEKNALPNAITVSGRVAMDETPGPSNR